MYIRCPEVSVVVRRGPFFLFNLVAFCLQVLVMNLAWSLDLSVVNGILDLLGCSENAPGGGARRRRKVTYMFPFPSPFYGTNILLCVRCFIGSLIAHMPAFCLFSSW